MLTTEDYQMALHSQTACNLSGLVRSLGMVLEGIWEEARAKGEGTDYVNEHPIVRLYVEQMIHLSKARATRYSDAYGICEERSEETEKD